MLTRKVSLRCFRRSSRWPATTALHAAHGVDVDDRAAVDLPEDALVELGQELLQRGRDQRLAVGGDDGDVLAVGPEVADVLDRDQRDLAALQHRDPAQGLLRRRELELLEQSAQVGGRRGEPLLEAPQRAREAHRLDRLQQVVDRALLEGLHGVLVVGGDEDDVARGRRRSARPRCRSARASGCRGRGRRAGAPRSRAAPGGRRGRPRARRARATASPAPRGSRRASSFSSSAMTAVVMRRPARALRASRLAGVRRAPSTRRIAILDRERHVEGHGRRRLREPQLRGVAVQRRQPLAQGGKIGAQEHLRGARLRAAGGAEGDEQPPPARDGVEPPGHGAGAGERQDGTQQRQGEQRREVALRGLGRRMQQDVGPDAGQRAADAQPGVDDRELALDCRRERAFRRAAWRAAARSGRSSSASAAAGSRSCRAPTRPSASNSNCGSTRACKASRRADCSRCAVRARSVSVAWTQAHRLLRGPPARVDDEADAALQEDGHVAPGDLARKDRCRRDRGVAGVSSIDEAADDADREQRAAVREPARHAVVDRARRDLHREHQRKPDGAMPSRDHLAKFVSGSRSGLTLGRKQ